MLTGKFFPLHKYFFAVVIYVVVFSSCGTGKKTTASHSSPESLPKKSSSTIKHSSTEENAISISESKKLQSKYAALLDVPVSKISNLELYKFVDEWMNAPYKYAGKSKSGVDCSGLCEILLNDVYGKNISGSSADIINACKEVDADDLKEGDLVFFKINSKNISHVGIYLVNNKFIHASVHSGVVIDDLNEAYYKKYFFKGGRI